MFVTSWYSSRPMRGCSMLCAMSRESPLLVRSVVLVSYVFQMVNEMPYAIFFVLFLRGKFLTTECTVKGTRALCKYNTVTRHRSWWWPSQQKPSENGPSPPILATIVNNVWYRVLNVFLLLSCWNKNISCLILLFVLAVQYHYRPSKYLLGAQACTYNISL